MAIHENITSFKLVNKNPIATITSSLLDNSYKVLDFSGAFLLQDFQNNSLVLGDEVTFSVTTSQSNTFIGTGTFVYGANLFSSTTLSSDIGFDTYIKPFLTGNVIDGQTYVFDKYGAVSLWNLNNGTLAGINAGEDWVITITAKDISLGTLSTNLDNTALFNKAN